MNTKAWYLSKTLWINLIAIVAMGIQTFNADFIISPEIQAGILGLINLVLRTITGTALDMGTSPAFTPPGSGGTGGGQASDAGYIQIPLLLICSSLLLIGFLINGCSTVSPATVPGTAVSAPTSKDSPLALAGKSLLAVKSTIVVAATSVDALCKSGTMSADKCARAKTAYELAKPAYDAAIDSYLLMSSGGGDPGDFGRALARVQDIAANLLALSGGAQ